MSLRCKNCGTSIEVPPDVAESPTPRVQCPSCKARYRLKPRATAASIAATSSPARPRPEGNGAPHGPGATATSSPPPFPSLTPATADPRAPTVATPSSPPANPTQDASRAASPSNVLCVDEVLAGRYRIRRFLAQGGMGEVYEAEDLELKEHIALKTIGGRSASSQPAIERFKREIHLARKVTHPNVCRIFDLGQHRPQGTPGAPPPPPVVFLTMELLKGETLSKRLRSRGRLATDEALPIAEQMAEALGAAHSAGIIHRDFKSENVFLVPREGGGTRVVVTDFGVARGTTDDQFSSLVTGAGIVGTPAYMAPEQVEGGEITAAADVYAFGVVLYEMVTGRLPFESENPLTTAVKRLKEPPPPPHIHVPHLEARWEDVILRCLARERDERPETPLEATRDLQKPQPAPTPAPSVVHPDEPSSGVEPPAQPEATKNRRRLILEVALLVSLAVLAVVMWSRRGGDEVVPRSSIAVLGFKNNNPQRTDVDWMATALSEMLGTELARSEKLRTISGETVARARRELEIQVGEDLAPESLRQVRTLLGCDYVVLGSFLAIPGPAGEQIRVDLRLQDAARGETLEALSESGAQTDLFTMVDALGTGLRDHLGVAAAAASQVSPLPSDAEAAKLYAQALDRLRGSEPQAARELLEKAVEIEPDHPMIHSALSTAWQALGYGSRAAEEASRAWELSSVLPEEEALLVEGRYAETHGDWARAIEIYDQLWERFPDDLEMGLRLASAQSEARAPAEALETVREIRRLPSPLSEDPRIDLAEAAAAALLSDFDRQLGASQKASGRARELGADLLLAQARLAESQAWRLLGRADEAFAAAQEAIEIYQRMQSTSGEALATTAAANVQFDRGDLEAAAEGFRRAIALYSSIGDLGSRAFALNNLALILKRRGEFAEARAHYEEAEQIYRELDNTLGAANTLNNLASLLVEQGHLGTAQMMFEKSLDAWEAAGNRHAAAFVRNNIGVVLRLQGRLTEAEEAHRRALETRRQLGHKAGIVASLSNLSDTRMDQGDLASARELLTEAREIATEIQDQSGLALVHFEQGRLLHLAGDLDEAFAELETSLSIREDLEEGPRITDTRIALARVELDRSNLAEAKRQASLALGGASEERRVAEESQALAVLARVAATHGDPAGSLDALSRARDLVQTNEQPAVQWRIELAALEVEELTDPASGIARLDRVRSLHQDATEGGNVELAMEARLLEARTLLSLNDPDAAREVLISLQSDASIHGLGNISQKADVLLSSEGPA